MNIVDCLKRIKELGFGLIESMGDILIFDLETKEVVFRIVVLYNGTFGVVREGVLDFVCGDVLCAFKYVLEQLELLRK